MSHVCVPEAADQRTAALNLRAVQGLESSSAARAEAANPIGSARRWVVFFFAFLDF